MDLSVQAVQTKLQIPLLEHISLLLPVIYRNGRRSACTKSIRLTDILLFTEMISIWAPDGFTMLISTKSSHSNPAPWAGYIPVGGTCRR